LSQIKDISVISLNSQFLLGVAHMITYATGCIPRPNMRNSYNLIMLHY